MVTIADITLGQILHTPTNEPLSTTDQGDGTYSLDVTQNGSNAKEIVNKDSLTVTAGSVYNETIDMFPKSIDWFNVAVKENNITTHPLKITIDYKNSQSDFQGDETIIDGSYFRYVTNRINVKTYNTVVQLHNDDTSDHTYELTVNGGA